MLYCTCTGRRLTMSLSLADIFTLHKCTKMQIERLRKQCKYDKTYEPLMTAYLDTLNQLSRLFIKGDGKP